MRRLVRSTACVILGLLLMFPVLAVAQPPDLPQGLDGESGVSSEPALPSGLGDDSGRGDRDGPGLPPGLAGGDPADDGPSLPEGLTGEPQSEPGGADEEEEEGGMPLDLHGYWEVRGGLRTQKDEAQASDAPVGESRLQLETSKAWGATRLQYTADVVLDSVLEQVDYDQRRLALTFRPHPRVDVTAGRQVLTWGTGDMLFINDLFPKDWPSFFIGRDSEYLKAPSDAVRIGWFLDWINVDFVYTPQFAHDRFIQGQRISYWNPLRGGPSGNANPVDYNAPDDWFSDDEFAVRLYRRFGAAEVALYGYWGYWKSSGGQRLIPLGQAAFPELRVYGASLRTTLGKGIFNAELGYYDSMADPQGRNPLVNNSEFRLLVGYEQELATEFTGAVQYYLEHMLDYEDYERNRFFFEPKRDRYRHVLTLRLTKLLMNQDLTLSFFGYWSPSDGDAYLRPRVTYKATNQWTLEAGGSIFAGRSDTTFFGQFEANTNIYAAARYSF